MATIYFPDTNVLLQCKALKELPWPELSQQQEIMIILLPSVVREIDKHKSSGNVRLARRARALNELFGQLLKSDPDTIALQKNPLVSIKFAPHLKVPRWSEFENLDPSNPDDKIIVEALTCHQAGHHGILLTNDTGLALNAKRHSLSYQHTPDDWFLEPEPDKRDKQISELQEILRKLQETKPNLKFVLSPKNGTELVPLHMQGFTSSEIRKLVSSLASLHPKKEFDLENIRQHYAASDVRKVEKYQAEYEKWLEDIEGFYEKLHEIYEIHSRSFSIEYALRNIGAVPADNLIIGVNAYNCYFMPKDLRQGKPELPVCPAPPQIKPINQNPFMAMTSFMQDIRRFNDPLSVPSFNSLQDIRRDKNAFYWKERIKGIESAYCSLECEEFRQQQEDYCRFDLYVPHGMLAEKATVKCTISARNIPEPIEQVIHISINPCATSIHEVIETGLLPQG